MDNTNQEQSRSEQDFGNRSFYNELDLGLDRELEALEDSLSFL